MPTDRVVLTFGALAKPIPHGRSLMPTDPTTGHETRGWLTDLERRVLRAVEQTAAEDGRDITVAEAVRRIRRLFHRVSTAQLRRDDGRCPTCGRKVPAAPPTSHEETPMPDETGRPAMPDETRAEVLEAMAQR